MGRTNLVVHDGLPLRTGGELAIGYRKQDDQQRRRPNRWPPPGSSFASNTADTAIMATIAIPLDRVVEAMMAKS